MRELHRKGQAAAGAYCLALLLWTAAPLAGAADVCEAEAKRAAEPAQHFMVLAGRNDVFYDRSGPAFVMLVQNSDAETDIGAFGIYADEARQPRFGAVPASTYETFLREPEATNEVMLRLQISDGQYQRALAVLRTWERRVREGALLYPDMALDNILLVKQATEELNRCSASITPYALDWGLDDEISEHNSPWRVPFEYFKTLRQLNEGKHVSDADMPPALLVASDTSAVASALSVSPASKQAAANVNP